MCGSQDGRRFGRRQYTRIATVARNISTEPFLQSQIVHRSDKSVPAAVEGFYITRILRFVTKGLAELLHGTVEAKIEINKRIAGPEPFLQFFPTHHSPGTFQQQGQNLKWLILQFDVHAPLAEFASLKIQLIRTEANHVRIF